MRFPLHSIPIVLSGALFACTEYNVGEKNDETAPDDTGTYVEPLYPDLLVEPSEVALGLICGDETTEIELTNGGDAPLTIEALTISGFGWSMDRVPALPHELAAGASVYFDVVGGDGEGTLLVQSDDPDTTLFEVPLSGAHDAAPSVIVTSPSSGEVIDPSTSPTFEAIVSDPGQDVENLLVEWVSSVDGLLATIAPSADGTVTYTWDPVQQSSGDHLVSAVVTDECGFMAVDDAEICQNEGYVTDNLDLSTWNFEGSAKWDSSNSWVELTTPTQGQAGTAFQTASTVSSDSVVIDFKFFVSGGTGADGISLTALDANRMTGFVGSTGGGIGYEGLPGWSIEVDTWYNSENNDPTTDDHVSVHVNGNVSNYAAWARLPEMEDDKWHDMSVTVSGTWMTVEIDGTTYIDQNISSLASFPAYVGFTGATGGSTNWHLIDALEVEAFVCEE